MVMNPAGPLNCSTLSGGWGEQSLEISDLKQ